MSQSPCQDVRYLAALAFYLAGLMSQSPCQDVRWRFQDERQRQSVATTLLLESKESHTSLHTVCLSRRTTPSAVGIFILLQLSVVTCLSANRFLALHTKADIHLHIHQLCSAWQTAVSSRPVGSVCVLRCTQQEAMLAEAGWAAWRLLQETRSVPVIHISPVRYLVEYVSFHS